MNKEYLLSFLIVMFSVAGCQNWNGVMPEKYDGQIIEKEDNIIQAYQENNEIIGEHKDLFIIEAMSQHLLKPSLPIAQVENQWMEEGSLVIGEDFPEGRYRFRYVIDPQSMIMGNATLSITDSNDNILLQELMSPFNVTMVEVDLREGNVVRFIGNDFPIEMGGEDITPEVISLIDFLHNNPNQNESSFELFTGIWEVGTHLESGTYVISQQPPEGYLYVFEQNMDPRIYQFKNSRLLYSEEPLENENHTEINLILKEGQKLLIKETGFPVVFNLDS